MNRASKGLLKPGPAAQLNWSDPLAQGLVFYVPFNEGAGNPRDLIQPPASPVFNGTAYWGRAGAGSGRGPSSSVGLTGDVSSGGNTVSAGIPAKLQFTQADSFTILAMVTCQGNSQQIWSTDPGGSPRTLIQTGVDSSGHLNLSFGDSGATLGTLAGTTNINTTPSSRLRHIVMVRDQPNAALSIWLDGILEASGADASTGTWTAGTSSGAGDWKTSFDSNASFDWVGQIACLAIWNRPLTAAEIQAHFQNPWRMLLQGAAVARSIGTFPPPQTVVGQGIPSTWSAGSGVVVGPPQRVFGQGLPSTWKAGYGNVDGGSPGMLLLIGGIQFPILRLGGSDPGPGGSGGATAPTIQSQTLGRWTAKFDVFDLANVYQPQVGQTVLLMEAGRRLFMGCIAEVSRELLISTQYVVHHVTALDKSSILDHRLVNITYLTGSEVADAVRNIINAQLAGEGITTNSVAASITTLDQDGQFYWVAARQAMDKLATDTACVWWVDIFGDMHFTPVVTLDPCPFQISDTSDTARGIVVRETLESYRNKQIAISNLQILPGGATGTASLEVTETYTLPQQEAEDRGFLFGAIITQQPIGQITGFTVNAVDQPVYLGTDGFNFRHVWWYFPLQPYITPPAVQNDVPAFPDPPVTSPDPMPGDVVVVKYVPSNPSGTPEGLAPPGFGLAVGAPLTATGGTCGTGIFEAVEQVKNVTLQANLDAIAAAVLQANTLVPKYLHFETDVPGAQVGQVIVADFPVLGVTPADSLMITSVSGASQGNLLAFGSSFRWQIVAQTGQDKGNDVKWFERFIARTENPLPVYQSDYLKFVLAPGTSLAGGVNVANNPDITGRSGKIVVAYAAAGMPPVGQDLLLDILVNGVSIFAAGQPLRIPAGDAALQQSTAFANGANSTYIFEGDLVTINASYSVLSGSVTAASGVTVSLKLAI